MKKLLIFIDFFLPGYKGGGPVTSVKNLVELIGDDFEILICTSNHDLGESDIYKSVESDKVLSRIKFNIIYLSNKSLINIRRVIYQFAPDFIYLNSFFSINTQKVLLINKFYRCNEVIVAPRGELQANALRLKKFKKYTYIMLSKMFGFYNGVSFHSTDLIESVRAKKIFPNNKIREIKNVVKASNTLPLSKSRDQLKIVFLSRISPKKNLHYAIEVIKDVKFDVEFDIYGPKEDKSYWEYCESLICSLPGHIKTSYKGSLEPATIPLILRNYHVFLFPTLSENFGHVIVEAMQSGLVPLISDQTPWVDLASYNAGWDIQLDNKMMFTQRIEELYLMGEIEYEYLSQSTINFIRNELDLDRIKMEYINFFNE